MKLTKSKLKQIIKEELENIFEQSEGYVLERGGVSADERFYVSGPASNPKFGPSGRAKVWKEKDMAELFSASLNRDTGEDTSVKAKKESE